MFLLLLLPISFYALSWVFMKKYQRNVGCGEFASAFYNMVGSCASFAILLCIKGFSLFWNIQTIICAIVFGCGLGIYNGFKVKAMARGPVALVSMSTTLGAVFLTTLYGTVLLHEEMNIMKILAMILVLCSFIPIILKQKSTKLTFSFIIMCILAFIFNGVLSCISKAAQVYTESSSQSIDFICLYFFFCFISSSILLMPRLTKATDADRKRIFSLPSIFVAMIAVGANTMAALLNFYLSFRFDASIEYPVVNVGIMISTTVLAFIMYREKPTKSTVVSLLLATASVICLSMG